MKTLVSFNYLIPEDFSSPRKISPTLQNPPTTFSQESLQKMDVDEVNDDFDNDDTGYGSNKIEIINCCIET